MGKAIPRNVLVRQGCVLTLPKGVVGQAQSRPAWLEGTREGGGGFLTEQYEYEYE